MPTRRDILKMARQSGIRQDYCKQCYENARRHYDLGIMPGQTGLIPVGPGLLGFLGSIGPALVAQLLSGCPQFQAQQAHSMYHGIPYEREEGAAPSPPSGPAMSYSKKCDRRQYALPLVGPIIGAAVSGIASGIASKMMQPEQSREEYGNTPLFSEGVKGFTSTSVTPVTRMTGSALGTAIGRKMSSPSQPTEHRESYNKKVNPWAICNSSVGSDKTNKRERCIQEIKAKNKNSGRA